MPKKVAWAGHGAMAIAKFVGAIGAMARERPQPIIRLKANLQAQRPDHELETAQPMQILHNQSAENRSASKLCLPTTGKLPRSRCVLGG